MEKNPRKLPALRAWILDRVVFLALVIFVAGAGMYIGADLLFHADSMWRHPIKELSLLLSMIGVVSLGYELVLRELTFNEYKEALREIVNPDAVRLGIKGIYKNRSELAQAFTFDKLFSKVKKEIFIGGSSLLSISTGSRELLKEKIRQGINVRLLIMNPDSEVVEIITRQIGGKATFHNEIKTSLLLFQKLEEELEAMEDPPPGKFEVRTYLNIPSHSFIAVDPEESGGIIVADIGPYLGRSHQRPSLFLIPKKRGMYGYYLDLANAQWKESQPVLAAASPGEAANTKTVLYASGISTEVFDKSAKAWRGAVICSLNPLWQGIKGAQWVAHREQLTLEEAITGGRQRFRRQFSLASQQVKALKRADLVLRADSVCHVQVNGTALKQDFGGAEFPDPFFLDISDYLVEGENSVEFEVINYAQPEVQAPEDNPLGLIYRLHLEYPE